jgi:hypothetical protein
MEKLEFHWDRDAACWESQVIEFALGRHTYKVKMDGQFFIASRWTENRGRIFDTYSTLDEAQESCQTALNNDISSIALANGYIKLQPGQVVVNESTHSLALHMAAKWAEHVAGNDRGVTFTRTSNLEARDE